MRSRCLALRPTRIAGPHCSHLLICSACQRSASASRSRASPAVGALAACSSSASTCFATVSHLLSNDRCPLRASDVGRPSPAARHAPLWRGTAAWRSVLDASRRAVSKHRQHWPHLQCWALLPAKGQQDEGRAAWPPRWQPGARVSGSSRACACACSPPAQGRPVTAQASQILFTQRKGGQARGRQQQHGCTPCSGLSLITKRLSSAPGNAREVTGVHCCKAASAGHAASGEHGSASCHTRARTGGQVNTLAVRWQLRHCGRGQRAECRSQRDRGCKRDHICVVTALSGIHAATQQRRRVQ